MLKSNIILAIIVCLVLTYVTTQAFIPGTNNRDFWAMVFPFAFSNICMIIKSMLKK